MSLTFNIPPSHSQKYDKDNPNSKAYDASKIEASIKGFRDAMSKENIMRLAKDAQAGGSPSANKKAKEQLKRRIRIAKLKQARLKKKK